MRRDGADLMQAIAKGESEYARCRVYNVPAMAVPTAELSVPPKRMMVPGQRHIELE
jgi:hypothetical protein